jgi:hypothetical protein
MRYGTRLANICVACLEFVIPSRQLEAVYIGRSPAGACPTELAGEFDVNGRVHQQMEVPVHHCGVMVLLLLP